MGSYTAGTFDSSASINGSTLIKDTDEQMAILMTDTTSYLNTEFNKIEVAVNDSLTDFDNLLQPSVDSATASARIAQQAAFVASSAQNFKGTWTNQTTAVGQSWEYQSKIYAVLIAGNTSPLVSPSNWLILNNFITKVTSTDNALARFNGTTGEVQDSGVIVDDGGNITINNGFTGGAGISFRNGYLPNANVGIYPKDFSGANLDGLAISSYDGFSISTGAGLPERMQIDYNGNVGIGVTPSGWGGYWKSVQMGTYGTNITSFQAGGGMTTLLHNAYNDGTDWKRLIGSAAAGYCQDGAGVHQWTTAPSGIAGSTITWNTPMTLTSSGNLLIGTTTDNGVGKLQVNGSISASNISSLPYFVITNPIQNQRYAVSGLNGMMHAYILSVYSEAGGNKLSELLAITTAFGNSSINRLGISGLAGYATMVEYRYNISQFEVRTTRDDRQSISIVIK